MCIIKNIFSSIYSIYSVYTSYDLDITQKEIGFVCVWFDTHHVKNIHICSIYWVYTSTYLLCHKDG